MNGSMSRNGFNIGDRVAVYIGESRYVLRLSEFTESGCLVFQSRDNIGHMTYLAHPKQCRRLKPKKRREWVVEVHYKRGCMYFSPQTGPCVPQGDRFIVREVFNTQKAQP